MLKIKQPNNLPFSYICFHYYRKGNEKENPVFRCSLFVAAFGIYLGLSGWMVGKGRRLRG